MAEDTKEGCAQGHLQLLISWALEKPVKFHRGIIESNFCSRIGDIGAQGKVSALVRLATRGRQRSTGSKKLKIPVRNVIYMSSPKFKPP